MSVALDEENMTSSDVRDALDDVYARRDEIKSATEALVNLIQVNV